MVYIKDKRTGEQESRVKVVGNMRTWVWLGLQPNARSLCSALLWNGELPFAEQARFKIQ